MLGWDMSRWGSLVHLPFLCARYKIGFYLDVYMHKPVCLFACPFSYTGMKNHMHIDRVPDTTPFNKASISIGGGITNSLLYALAYASTMNWTELSRKVSPWTNSYDMVKPHGNYTYIYRTRTS